MTTNSHKHTKTHTNYLFFSRSSGGTPTLLKKKNDSSFQLPCSRRDKWSMAILTPVLLGARTQQHWGLGLGPLEGEGERLRAAIV